MSSLHIEDDKMDDSESEQQIVQIENVEIKMNDQEKEEAKQQYLDLGNRYDKYKLQPMLPEGAEKEQKHLYNKLKVFQLIEAENVSEEDKEHFSCQVCKQIVKQPLECNTCSGLVCADCLQAFQKDSNRNNASCPCNLNGICSGIKNQKFGKLNQFVSRHLNQLRFTCMHKECQALGEKGALYEDAINHVRKCNYQRYACPYKCGDTQGILGKDLDDHFKICPGFKEQCPKCRIFFSRSEIKTHDCMTELKKLVKVQNHQIDDISTQFGLVTHKFAPKCSRGHILQLVRGRVMEYNGTPQCDRCRQSQLHYHEALYHCPQCKYDLCRACALIQNKVLAVSQKTSIHNCNLEKQPSTRGNGWRCDARKLRPDDKGCESGVTDYYQPQGLQNWRCTSCDYDLCIKCMMKYKILEISTLSDYQKTQLTCMVSGDLRLGTVYHQPVDMEEAKNFCNYHKDVKSNDKPIQYLIIENNEIKDLNMRDDQVKEFDEMIEQAIEDGMLSKDKPIYSKVDAMTQKYRVYYIGKTDGEDDLAGIQVQSYIFNDLETANKYLTNSFDSIEQYFMVKDFDIQESLDLYNEKFKDEYYEQCMQQAMEDGYMKD